MNDILIYGISRHLPRSLAGAAEHRTGFEPYPAASSFAKAQSVSSVSGAQPTAAGLTALAEIKDA